MSKKLVALTTSLLIGGTLLGTTALASANESSGYEAYKAALLNMRNVKSMTDTIKISAMDNGTSLEASTITVKVNKDTEAMSSEAYIRLGDTEKSKAVYRQDGKMITKDSSSEVYSVIQMPDEYKKMQQRKPDEKVVAKRMENLTNIVDALIGDRKNNFVMTENSDGTKDINVKLSEKQVLPVANAIAAAVVKDRKDIAVNRGIAQDKVDIELPKLDKDIRITNVDITAVINKDNLIEKQTGTITLAGKDASGVEHTLVLNIDMNISNLNNTTPDAVNLEGKQVKTVTPEQLKHQR